MQRQLVMLAFKSPLSATLLHGNDSPLIYFFSWIHDEKGKPGGFPFFCVLAHRFPGVDPTTGSTVLPCVMLDLDERLLIEQMFSVDS